MLLDFYVYSPHETVLWKPVWQALRERGVDAQFVVEPPGVCTASGSVPDPKQGYRDVKTENLRPLMTPEAYAAITGLLRDLGCSFLDRSRRKEADAVVTTQGTGWLWRYRGLKFRTMYGVGATRDSYGHGPVNQGMDAVFVHGELSRQASSAHVPADRIFACGFPKYSAYFRGEVSLSEWRERFRLDPRKKTLAYLPTWAHNSSLGRYPEAIARLAGEYNVLCKPHHNNLHFERERLQPLLEAPGVTVAAGVPTIVPFLACADVVLADVRSGAFTEAFLLDRPTVGLSPAGDREADNLIDAAYEAAAVCGDHTQLEALVQEAAEHDPYRQGRRRLAARLFSSHEGQDDVVMAEAMIARIRAVAPRTQLTAEALLEQGEQLFNQGDMGGACRLFREALRLDPESGTAWNNMGAALLSAGHVDPALQAFRQAQRLDPSDVGPLLNLGQVLFHSGDPSGAAEAFQRALTLAPNDPRVRELVPQFAA